MEKPSVPLLLIVTMPMALILVTHHVARLFTLLKVKTNVKYLLLQYYLLIFPLIIVDVMVPVVDTVQVVYTSGTDTTPLYESISRYYNGFTGFRI